MKKGQKVGDAKARLREHLQAAVLENLNLLQRDASAPLAKYLVLAVLEELAVDNRVLELINRGWPGGQDAVNRNFKEVYFLAYLARKAAYEIGINANQYGAWYRTVQLDFDYRREHSKPMSENALAKEAGISRRTLSRWRNNPRYKSLIGAKLAFSS